MFRTGVFGHQPTTAATIGVQALPFDVAQLKAKVFLDNA